MNLRHAPVFAVLILTRAVWAGPAAAAHPAPATESTAGTVTARSTEAPLARPSDSRIVIRNHPDNAYFFEDRVEVPCACEKCVKFPPPVRAHPFPGPHQYASTLAHERGHNLGLAHTPRNQPGNLMTVARKDNLLSAEQWAVIHHTLRTQCVALSGSAVGVMMLQARALV
jgi:hypothetical protein